MKQLKQLLTAAAVIFCIGVGLVQLIEPSWVSEVIARIFGGVTVLLAIYFGSALYKIYEGKPVFRTWMNQK